MKIRESVTIHATAETVWFFLDDPDMVKQWNPKVKDWQPVSQGNHGQGYAFRILYGMSNKHTWFDAVFSEYSPFTRLVWSLTDPKKPQLAPTTLTYTLEAKGDNVRLTQVIEFDDKVIPWPLRWLVLFILKFGKPMNETRDGKAETYLETLKRFAEGV